MARHRSEADLGPWQPTRRFSLIRNDANRARRSFSIGFARHKEVSLNNSWGSQLYAFQIRSSWAQFLRPVRFERIAFSISSLFATSPQILTPPASTCRRARSALWQAWSP